MSLRGSSSARPRYSKATRSLPQQEPNCWAAALRVAAVLSSAVNNVVLPRGSGGVEGSTCRPILHRQPRKAPERHSHRRLRLVSLSKQTRIVSPAESDSFRAMDD